MDTFSEPIPPFERFGFDIIDRAFRGPQLQPWENDYARIFWQCLEVANGGFEQWIGNTGKAGVIETLEALERFSLFEALRITKEVFVLVSLDTYDENAHYEHLNKTIDWFAKLRVLDEAFWGEIENIHKTLKGFHQSRVVEMQ